MNDNYLNLQNCTNQIISVNFEDRLGLSENPFNCPSDLIWFTRDIDFNLIDFAQGELSVEREDVSSNMALKQTEGNMLSWTKTFPIQAREGSKLQQFLLEIMINERTSNRDGQGIIAYANGGIHYERTVTYNEGTDSEFKIKMLFLNLKAENFPDVYSGDITSDTTYEWSILVENYPHYLISGNVPAEFAIPTGVVAPTIGFDEVTLTQTSVTVSALTLLDTDLVAMDTNITITLYDADSLEFLDTQVVASGNDYVYNGSVDNVRIELAYAISDTILMTNAILIENQPAVLNPAVGTIDDTPTITVDTISGTFNYTANDDSISLATMTIAETATPTTVIATDTTITEGANTYSFATLTADTEYIISLIQDTLVLDTLTATTSAVLFKATAAKKLKK